jgi:hypothetical protein
MKACGDALQKKSFELKKNIFRDNGCFAQNRRERTASEIAELKTARG